MQYKNMIKLPESELEVMQAIWLLNEAGEKAVSAGLIMDRYPELNRLKLTTVLTLITRLHSKGFIKIEKIGRSNCYKPIVPLKEYRKFALKDFAEKLYGTDKVGFVKMILSDGSLTKKELEELMDYITV